MRKVRRIYQEINETIFDDAFEFMSEADMIKAGYDETPVYDINSRFKNDTGCNPAVELSNHDVQLQ